MPFSRPPHSRKPGSRMLPLVAVLGFFVIGSPAPAATISTGDVTSALGPMFFVDDALNGGADADINQPSVAAYNRYFSGLLTRNQGPVRISLTGFGFAAHTSATANDATSVAITFTYLGADELLNGGDDVVIGTATGTYNFTAGGEYVFAFDAPLTANLNITGTRFRIQIAPTNTSGNGSLKLKTGPLTYEAADGPKLSVAGFVAPQRVNLAKYQAVTVDSVNGQRLASYVTDGVVGNDNRWVSDSSGPHWAQVTFPYPVQVGSAQVFSGFDDGSAITSFKLQYLSDATWVDVSGGSVTGNTNVENNLVFSSPVTSSSFRIYSTDGTMRVKELALYPPNGGNAYPLGTDITLDLAFQRPAVATANSAGNFALLAVDGRVNKDSKWQTTLVGSNSLEIDLRVATRIGSAHLYSGSPGVSPLASFILRYWDGTAWQDIPGGSVTGNAAADLVIPFTSVVTTSKVRLEFTNAGTTSVRELCVFPANTDNPGYPIGASVIGAAPVAAKFDDYNDAFYKITNTSANRFIAVSNGTPCLNLSGQAAGEGQYQVLLNAGTGTYRLRNRATGFCLSGAQLSTNPGDLLVDAPYSALPDQDWILESIDGTNFQIINQWSGLVIDAQGGDTAAGTPLVQSLNTGAASQRWQMVYSAKFPKKGVGGTSFATSFNINWVYNWGLTNTRILPAGAVFSPMQWGDYNWDAGTSSASTSKLYPAWRTTSEPLHLLGFNEPDTWSQSGRSLDPNNPPTEADFSATRSMTEAVMLWPRLQAMDVPLVAPCPANMTGGWLSSFYTQANSLGYRVDYTAKHSYGSPNNGSSDGLINDLQTGYTNWGRPMWLTEFSFVDWGGNSAWSEEDCYNALAEFLWRAESVSWLRKYALFVFTEDANNPQPANPWQDFTPAPRSNSYDISGNMTAFGKLYAAWDNDAVVRTDKTYQIHNKNTRKRIANLTTQSNVAGRNIRIDGALVHWTLVAAPTSGRYYIVSLLDGRRLSSDGTTVSLVAPGTTGTAVEWSLAESQATYGWYYLNHPASTKRLKMVYNNSNFVATYSMAANTTTTDDVQWRFIVPAPPPAWSGASDAGWTTTNNWIPGVVPSTGDEVNFDSSSTANLNTVLNQDFDLLGVNVTNPAGPVSIGGTNTLTLGGGGIDLAAASQNLTITAPVVLGSAQSWSVASGRTLGLNGGVSGNNGFTVTGAGKVSLGGAASHTGTTTINPGATLQTVVPDVLPNGASAGNLVVNGALDLNGTSQSINGLSGTGVIDNTAAAAASLIVGLNDTAVTLGTLLQNTNASLALLKTGSGNLILPGANTHSGGFTNNGTGNVAPQNINAFGGGPVVMNAGTLYSTAGNYTFSNPLTLNGATLRVGGGTGRTLTWTGPVDVTADSIIQSDGSTAGITLSGGVTMNGFTLSSAPNGTANTISGPVSGTGTIMAATFSNGTLHLNAANPFSGTFRSALGTLKIGDTHAMQNGTLDMNAADSGGVSLNNLNAVIGALTGTRNLALGTGTVFIGNNNASTTFGGILSGTGSLVKTGNGTLTLTGANSYTGTTSVNAGTLALGAGNVLPGTAVSIGNATLDAGTFADTAGTLDVTSTAKINLGTGTTLAFANSSAIDWSGGSLNITGAFVPGTSLRFGTTSGGLSPAQLALISAPGYAVFSLTSTGHLTAVAAGSYDAWKSQITNGQNGRTQDADGDGFTNLEEFLFGTSPVSNNGQLVTTSASGGNLVLRWLQRESGATYALKQSATLVPGSWATAPQIPAPDGDQSGAPSDYDYYKVTLPTGGGRWFFRIEGVEN